MSAMETFNFWLGGMVVSMGFSIFIGYLPEPHYVGRYAFIGHMYELWLTRSARRRDCVAHIGW